MVVVVIQLCIKYLCESVYILEVYTKRQLLFLFFSFLPGFAFNCNLMGHTPNFVVVLPLFSFFFLPSFLPSSGNREETRNSNHVTRGSPLRAPKMYVPLHSPDPPPSPVAIELEHSRDRTHYPGVCAQHCYVCT